MQDTGSEEVYTFHCDRWLSRDKEDFDVVREFPISGKSGSTPKGKGHFYICQCTVVKIPDSLLIGFLLKLKHFISVLIIICIFFNLKDLELYIFLHHQW